MINTDIKTLYQRFNEESISQKQITRWLEQFDTDDQPTALFLAGLIDYWGYQRVHFGLRSLHARLMQQLAKDGFTSEFDNDNSYERIDFSRSFCSKSGDLISYFYRKMNGMRSLEFSNLEALETRQDDLSERALVIFDDYVGTGCQFLSNSYRKSHYELFNRYGKIYVATLIANNQAIQTFKQVNQGNYETLVSLQCDIEEMTDLEEIADLRQSFKKILPGKSHLVYTNREISLLEPESHLTTEQCTRIKNLISKYTHQKYCHD